MDKDDPGDVLNILQLLMMAVWAICILPFALLIAWIRDEGMTTPNRVTCSNCGYRMVDLEVSCPQCRANQQRMK
jgi:lipopolysaccharide biosynthesis regulator YciM